jgi:hypothetical protein
VSWLETLPALFVALAIVLLPGAALAWGLGFRKTGLFGLAPLFSLTLAGMGAVIAAWMGVPWNPAVILAATVLTTAGAWFLIGRRAAVEAPLPERWTVLATAVAGVSAAGVLIGRRITQLVGAPDNISQRYDNIFHLNAVRYVLDTENASSLDLGRMGGNGSGRATIYPAVWHSLAALVTQLSGSEIAVSVNVVNLVAAAVVWPISIVFLTRVILGPRLIALAGAAILSGGFVAFPYLLMVWGPLFPNLLSASVLPAALAAVILVCRNAPVTDEPPLHSWLALLVGLPGLALSHMSSVNALLAFSAPILLWTLAAHFRKLIHARAPLARYVLPIAATLLGGALAVTVWRLVRPGFYGGWKPHQSVPGAVGEVISNAPVGTDVAIVTSLLALIGIATIVRRQTLWWLLGCYLVAGYLYVVDAGYEAGWARDFFTGTWYQDVKRLAAYLPIFATVLGALGVASVVDALRQLVTGRDGRLKRLISARRSGLTLAGGTRLPDLAGGLVVCALLVMLTQTGTVRDYILDHKIDYKRDFKESILSSDEYKLLDRLPSEVPEDAVIAVNPWNGGSLAYAFADRKVLEYFQTQRADPDLRIIAENLANAGTDPKVCLAVRKLKVTYALDFGNQYLMDHPSTRMYSGLQDLEKSRGLQLMDSEGEAKLFKVTACG